MIQPLNKHILVEPLKHESFVAQEKETYQEIGIVVCLPATNCGSSTSEYGQIKVGDKVYFDSWMIAKFPSPTKEGDDIWLVKYEDIRAYDRD